MGGDAWVIRVVDAGNAERLVLEAAVGDQIVGRAKTHRFETDSGAAPAGHYLGGVSVLPDYQRRGIGSALTSLRLDWIGERSPEAWFFTNARNDASIALHARFGFVEVARGSQFHGVAFDGGEGILFRASLR